MISNHGFYRVQGSGFPVIEVVYIIWHFTREEPDMSWYHDIPWSTMPGKLYPKCKAQRWSLRLLVYESWMAILPLLQWSPSKSALGEDEWQNSSSWIQLVFHFKKDNMNKDYSSTSLSQKSSFELETFFFPKLFTTNLGLVVMVYWFIDVYSLIF